MADFFLHSSHPDRYSGVDLPLFSIFHRRPGNKGFTLADDDFCPSSNNTSAVRKTQIACSRGGLFNGHILSYHYNYSANFYKHSTERSACVFVVCGHMYFTGDPFVSRPRQGHQPPPHLPCNWPAPTDCSQRTLEARP